MARLFAGTSGFSYPEWKGTFYPAKVKTEEMLAFYSGAFPTVEINNSFYRYPKAETLVQWREQTPEGFRFAVKAHRRITHDKRLRGVADDVSFLAGRFQELGNRLGPVLFQLPPSVKCDVALLGNFLRALPPVIGRAMEFRHASWFSDEVYALLAEHRTALCIAEDGDRAAVTVDVGPFGYLRLHRSSYGDEDLRRWAAYVEARLGKGQDVYAYFTHEEGAPAPQYAQTLNTLVRKASGDAE
ncbi:MAG: DUF72 domain-containing protein [Armatimonadetes bacterium]|nr:DUF72 domain-containing protein [Armatimonadota bacterium]